MSVIAFIHLKEHKDSENSCPSERLVKRRNRSLMEVSRQKEDKNYPTPDSVEK
jgi:hypothetical protein